MSVVNDFNITDYFLDANLTIIEKFKYAELVFEDQRINLERRRMERESSYLDMKIYIEMKRIDLQVKKVYKDILGKIVKFVIPFVWGWACYLFFRQLNRLVNPDAITPSLVLSAVIFRSSKERS
jgi:hypothetical protein